MSRYSHSSRILREALNRLEVRLNETDIRRLIPLVKGYTTTANAVKHLRKIISIHRVTPLELLKMKGVGKKTYSSIDTLFLCIVAKENLKDNNVHSNVDAAIANLRVIRMQCPAKLHKNVDSVLKELNKLSANITNELLSRGKTPKKVSKRKPIKGNLTFPG